MGDSPADQAGGDGELAVEDECAGDVEDHCGGDGPVDRQPLDPAGQQDALDPATEVGAVGLRELTAEEQQGRGQPRGQGRGRGAAVARGNTYQVVCQRAQPRGRRPRALGLCGEYRLLEVVELVALLLEGGGQLDDRQANPAGALHVQPDLQVAHLDLDLASQGQGARDAVDEEVGLAFEGVGPSLIGEEVALDDGGGEARPVHQAGEVLHLLAEGVTLPGSPAVARERQPEGVGLDGVEGEGHEEGGPQEGAGVDLLDQHGQACWLEAGRLGHERGVEQLRVRGSPVDEKLHLEVVPPHQLVYREAGLLRGQRPLSCDRNRDL